MLAPRRPRTFVHVLTYILSLPERLLRAIIGFIGGLGLMLCLLLPRFFRGTRFYKVAVERQLRILAQSIGGAELPAEEGAPDSTMIKRKLVGDTIDNIALATLHVSPIWILLALSDTVRGASHVTQEILTELKDQGVVPADSKIHNLDTFLGSISDTTSSLADTASLPPLNVKHLRRTTKELRERAAGIDVGSVIGVADLEEALSALKSHAKSENKSLLQASAEVTAHWAARATSFTRDLTLASFFTVKTSSKIVYRELVGSYLDSLASIQKEGFVTALTKTVKPHRLAFRMNFAPRKLTFIELGLSMGKWKHAPWRLRPIPKPAQESTGTKTT